MQHSKNPKQGEIWLVDLDPIKGHEKAKSRPCVVISNYYMAKSSLRLIVPLTSIQYDPDLNIEISENAVNNLHHTSYVDPMHIRSVDLIRFRNKIGEVTEEQLDEILLITEMLIEK